MSRYAVVDSAGNVLNVILADPANFDPGSGLSLVDPGDVPVEPGWTYANGQFQPPAPPPLPSLQEAQAAKIAEINNAAYQLLAPTDWAVLRAAEGYQPLPADLAAYRKAVRDAANKAVNDLQAMTDVQAVLSYQVAWPAPLPQYDRPETS